MKFLNFFLIILFVSFSVTQITYAKDRKLILVAEEFPPFEFMSKEENKVVGIEVDLASYILNQLKVDFEIKFYPWKRAWKMIEKGSADAVLSVSFKEKRVPFLYYPEEEIWSSSYVFFTNVKNKKTKTYTYKDAQKSSARVGITNGYSYNADFWKAFPYGENKSYNYLLQPATSINDSLKKLGKNRIDVFIIDKIVGQFTVNKLHLSDKIVKYDNVLFSKKYYLPFSKKSNYPGLKKLVGRFSDELKKMKANGKYHEIMDKWLKPNN